MQNKNVLIFTIFIIFILSSCAVKVKKNVFKKYPALEYNEEVKIYGMTETEPENAKDIGLIKIGTTGFTTNCELSDVFEQARLEARKIGGNAIKLIDHESPNFLTSCHRIKVRVLKIENIDKNSIVDTLKNCAIIYFFRENTNYGTDLKYEVKVNDSSFCKIKNNFKKAYKTFKESKIEISAKTSSKVILTLDIKFGNVYYIKCDSEMGDISLIPAFTIIDKNIGKIEYELTGN